MVFKPLSDPIVDGKPGHGQPQKSNPHRRMIDGADVSATIMNVYKQPVPELQDLGYIRRLDDCADLMVESKHPLDAQKQSTYRLEHNERSHYDAHVSVPLPKCWFLHSLSLHYILFWRSVKVSGRK